MIIEYHRPETIDEALDLLARSQPATVPLGGGTVLNQPMDYEIVTIVGEVTISAGAAIVGDERHIVAWEIE